MDHLLQAKTFANLAYERTGIKPERASMDIELAKAHALIALVERMDAMTIGVEGEPVKRALIIATTVAAR